MRIPTLSSRNVRVIRSNTTSSLYKWLHVRRLYVLNLHAAVENSDNGLTNGKRTAHKSGPSDNEEPISEPSKASLADIPPVALAKHQSVLFQLISLRSPIIVHPGSTFGG